MNRYFMASLRHRAAILAVVLAFCPAAVNAYTSNGSDGAFHPVVSTVLPSSQTIFNYLDIFIPAGVTVTYTFAGPTLTHPIEFLATGNIDVEGTLQLDAGTNALWLETPGTLNISGSFIALKGDISLYAGSQGSSGVTGVGGGAGTAGSAAGVIISLGGGLFGVGPVITGGGGLFDRGPLTPLSGATVALGGSVTLVVPEPETDAMLLMGLGLMGALAGRRKAKQL